ncbi:hypothetical protein CBW65_18730 [Tumebacillus avium]|uniref:Uncharacterized protein n=1 Tax=Tumebacillus avium TaxID=1903704 RepID=A0A1Y0IQC4_9BACL|nr:hypothetical protein [Tumebacillus avium]ARU62778.1 hypothetical protein CBW65_18730 [Tumebacillus avium]
MFRLKLQSEIRLIHIIWTDLLSMRFLSLFIVIWHFKERLVWRRELQRKPIEKGLSECAKALFCVYFPFLMQYQERERAVIAGSFGSLAGVCLACSISRASSAWKVLRVVRDQAGRQQRVPAECEEIVMYADLRDVEQARPNLSQLRRGLVATARPTRTVLDFGC